MIDYVTGSLIVDEMCLGWGWVITPLDFRLSKCYVGHLENFRDFGNAKAQIRIFENRQHAQLLPVITMVHIGRVQSKARVVGCNI